MQACLTLAKIKTSMPEFIQKKIDKKRSKPRHGESGLTIRDDGDHAPGWVGGFRGGAIIH
jgi:hypothetical protein